MSRLIDGLDMTLNVFDWAVKLPIPIIHNIKKDW